MNNKLSVYIIAYNEEPKITDCLESVKWADEIVLADSFSTDKTAEIAKRYGAKVVQLKFEGFGKLRNAAIENCTYEWILSVDADERVTGELKEEIRSLLEKGPKAEAYFIPRKSHFLGYWIRHCGWYPDYRQPQLFKKGKMRYKEQLVHESFELSGKASYLRQHVLQFPFNTLDQFLKKMDRYSSLRAREILAEGKRFKTSNLIVNPVAMFFRMYIFKLGFLDGFMGLMLSILYGFYYTLMKYVKLWDISRAETNKNE
jgi:glycosyltransferase involved in cell wall biosynthesis